MLAHFAHHVLTALMTPLLPFIRDDFGLDYTQSGLLLSALTLSYGISHLPAGWLADRLGPRILITVGISGVALAGLFVGLSQTYIMLIVFLVLMGMAGGGYHPSASPLISASVEPNKRGRALGLHLIGGGASFFVAPLIAAGIAATLGWRGSFVALAIPAIAFGIVFYVLLGRRADIKRAEHKITDTHKETPSAPGHRRRLIAFMSLNIIVQSVLYSAIAFIPLFMVDHFGVSEETAAIFLAVIYSAGLWVSPLGGYLSDRLGRVPVTLVACLIVGPVIYLLTLASYGLGIGAVLVILGIVMYIRMPASEAYIIGELPARRRSTILGIYYFAGMEGGGLLTPVLGSLIDQFGFHTSFTAVAATLVVATLVCGIFLWGSRD